jgi:hypothetical protein
MNHMGLPMKKHCLLLSMFFALQTACTETVSAEIEYGDERDKSLDDDNDGLSNFDEEEAGTDPLVADTDGDGINDKKELDQGFDPLDENDKPYLGEYPIARCDPTVESTGNSVGDVANDFTSTDQHGEELTLSDFCDSVVIIEASAYG